MPPFDSFRWGCNLQVQPFNSSCSTPQLCKWMSSPLASPLACLALIGEIQPKQWSISRSQFVCQFSWPRLIRYIQIHLSMHLADEWKSHNSEFTLDTCFSAWASRYTWDIFVNSFWSFPIQPSFKFALFRLQSHPSESFSQAVERSVALPAPKCNRPGQ